MLHPHYPEEISKRSLFLRVAHRLYVSLWSRKKNWQRRHQDNRDFVPRFSKKTSKAAGDVSIVKEVSDHLLIWKISIGLLDPLPHLLVLTLYLYYQSQFVSSFDFPCSKINLGMNYTCLLVSTTWWFFLISYLQTGFPSGQSYIPFLASKVFFLTKITTINNNLCLHCMILCNVPYTFAKLRKQNRWLMNAGVLRYTYIYSLKAIPIYLKNRQFLREIKR